MTAPDLSTTYLGLRLSTPLVPSASPLGRTLDNLQTILLAAGSSLREVVRIGVYLADLADFDAMNEVFRKYFPEDPPARTTIGANLPKIKIEIDCIARVGRGKNR